MPSYNNFKKKQLSNINSEYYIDKENFLRLNKFINKNILGNKCCLCVYKKKPNNYYTLNGKRQSLHRLLYINLVSPLNRQNYLIKECDTLKCCNPFHYKMKTYKIKQNIYTINKDDLIPKLNKNGEIILKFQ